MRFSLPAGPQRFLRRIDRLLPVLFVLSLAVVCLTVGAYVAEFNVPWYQKTLKPSFRGLQAIYEESQPGQQLQGWTRSHGHGKGTTVHDQQLAYDGLTLYASFADGCAARLISMDGKVVHRWRLPFDKAWPNQEHVPTPVTEDRIHWWRVRVFPNGDLIANYAGIGDTPNGYGLVKIDRYSNIIWQYADCAHHDFDIDAKGQVYALVHSISDVAVRGAPHLRTPLLKDEIAVLSPDGKEIHRVSIFDAFAQSDFCGYVDAMKSDRKGDHTHANAIDVVTEEFAARHKYCSAGDVMVSLRNPGLLAILNLEQKKVVWAGRGTWERQHDCDPLANGNIMLFDNRGKKGTGGQSRVLEWNPDSGAIEWSYTGSGEQKFETITRGSQQLLPNGNVLITESNNGRILEVTRDQRIAWEFRNPSRLDTDARMVAVIFNAERYERDKLPFLTDGSLASSKPKSKSKSKSIRTASAPTSKSKVR
jgi:hypothetical protein